MRKLIYTIIFLLMLSTVAIAHEYCGKACSHEYEYDTGNDKVVMKAIGCAAYRALEEFNMFELTIDGHKIGRVIEKTKLISEVTESKVVIGMKTPDKSKPLNSELLFLIFDYPQPGMNTALTFKITFKDDEYTKLKWTVESELSGRQGRKFIEPPITNYGMFDYMIETYEAMDLD